jgi:hypothetical protein
MRAGPSRRRVLRSVGIASLISAATRVALATAADAQIAIIDAHTHIVRHLDQTRGRAGRRGGG